MCRNSLQKIGNIQDHVVNVSHKKYLSLFKNLEIKHNICHLLYGVQYMPEVRISCLTYIVKICG